MIVSIVSCGIEGLRPRPLRTSPNFATPSSANRARQFATDAGDTDNARATAVLAAPSAAINNAFARTTSRWAPDCDRANDSSNSRCPSEISNATTGFLIHGFYRTNPDYLRDTPLGTSGNGWCAARSLGKVTRDQRTANRTRLTRRNPG